MKKKLDLKSEHLQIVCRIIEKYAPDQIVWAYGSRVKGKAHEGSDLDLILLNPKNLEAPQSNVLELRKAFKESSVPISIDIFDWALIPISFRQSIQKDYVKVWPLSDD